MKRILHEKWFRYLTATVFILSAAPCFSQEAATVRLAMVNVPDDLVRPLIPEFQKETGFKAEIVYTGVDPFSVARTGKADLVISHYGHPGVEPFVTGGWGLWPRTVFANQLILLGPTDDPAHVRGIADVVEAFRRIAASKSLFVSNNSDNAKYLEQILWSSAKISDKGSWYLDQNSKGPRAIRQANKKGAYVLWGLPPFLRLKKRGMVNLEPLVVSDPILQRIMVAIAVNPDKITNINTAGAKSFQDFLIEPATQARIRAFRYPDFNGQAWWPAGRNNDNHD